MVVSGKPHFHVLCCHFNLWPWRLGLGQGTVKVVVIEEYPPAQNQCMQEKYSCKKKRSEAFHQQHTSITWCDLFWPNLSKKKETTSVHDVWERLQQALWASRDVMLSSQICVLKSQRFFTLPFESKLLPAVLLFLRIYFPKITVTVIVLKFGRVSITVTVSASAVTPWFPLIPNYRLESHLNYFPKITVTVTVLKCFWIRKVIISNMTVHAGKIVLQKELYFFANTCGACIRTRANTGKYFWGVIFCILAKFSREIILGRMHVAPVFPKGPNLEKIQDLEIFKRAWNFQASHPPNPYFCGEFWRSGLNISSEIEIFKGDWKFQAILNFFKIWALRVFLQKELYFLRIHAGPVFALPRIQENIFEESFSAY